MWAAVWERRQRLAAGGDLLGLGQEIERKGQRREPATKRTRIATRRAGWRPFAGPTGWLLIMASSPSN